MNYLCKYILNAAKVCPHCNGLVIAGGFDLNLRDKAVFVSTRNIKVLADLSCNHEEADTCIWYRIKHTSHNTYLVFSPDTGIYHIGLPLISTNKLVYVQLHKFNATTENHKYLNMAKFVEAISQHMSLCQIPTNDVTRFVEMLFIASGCDFVSYFVRQGKVTFLSKAFSASDFIYNGSLPNGKKMAGNFTSTPSVDCNECKREDLNTQCTSCLSKYKLSLLAFF